MTRFGSIANNFWKWTFIAASCLLVAGCGDDDPDENENGDSFDRSAMLVNYADNVITPAYRAFDQKVSELDGAAATFAVDPTPENLAATRSAWVEAADAWQYVALYDFGPAFGNGLLGLVNIYPIDTALVSSNISAGIYNLESPQNADATGFQALDFLLWGTGGSDTEILSYFSSADNARKYLTDITALLSGKAGAARSEWEGSYRNTFVGATGTDIGSSLGQLINASVRYYERNLRDGKIGIPAGARTSLGEPLPDLVEGLYSKSHSKKFLQSGVRAWQDMFNGIGHEGADGSGLSDYLNFLGTEYEAGMPLHEEINRRFDLVKADTEVLNEDLSTAVQDQQTESLEVFDEMQRTVVLLKVDMTSAMGIQITFADNDGD